MGDHDEPADRLFEELSISDRLKQEIDELRLQIHLGKAEAEDFIEEHKGKFSDFLGGVKTRVQEAREVGEEKAKAVRQKVDELQVQLALGKMESRDAIEDQRNRIGGAVEALKEELEPAAGDTGSLWEEIKEQFEAGSDALSTKMDTLKLNFGLATAEIGEELKLKKDQLGEELRDLSIKLFDVGQSAKGKFNEISDDVTEGISKLRKRLKDWF